MSPAETRLWLWADCVRLPPGYRIPDAYGNGYRLQHTPDRVRRPSPLHRPRPVRRQHLLGCKAEFIGLLYEPPVAPDRGPILLWGRGYRVTHTGRHQMGTLDQTRRASRVAQLRLAQLRLRPRVGVQSSPLVRVGPVHIRPLQLAAPM